MTFNEARAALLASYSEEELQALIAKFSASADYARSKGLLNVAAGDLVRAGEFKAELDYREERARTAA